MLPDESVRRRLIATLFAGNALSSSAYILAITAATLVVIDLAGNPLLAGLPSAAATLGTAVGTSLLASLSRRVGRRGPFIFGFAIASLGGMAAAAAVQARSLLWLLAAMAIIGLGRSVSSLSRFAAADMRLPEHRGSAIAVIVWAATIGSVVGPALLVPSAAAAVRLGAASLAGAYLFAGVLFLASSAILWVFLRPDPMSMAVETQEEAASGEGLTPIRTLLGGRTVQLALMAMLVSQFVMVLVMTMTPLHIRGAGGGLEIVGWVMTSHTLGMFALSPLTGRMVDRLGPPRVIGISVVMLVVACGFAATAGQAQTSILLFSLFLLGLGWNFGFVAGSAQLQHNLDLGDRVRLQGFADSATWIAGGTAAVLSGVIRGVTSYPVLAVAGLVLTLLMVVPLLRLPQARRLEGRLRIDPGTGTDGAG